jgi:hypothetical protein
MMFKRYAAISIASLLALLLILPTTESAHGNRVMSALSESNSIDNFSIAVILICAGWSIFGLLRYQANRQGDHPQNRKQDH